MHLVLGHTDDICCTALLGRLHASGLDAAHLTTPFESSARPWLEISPDGSFSAGCAIDGEWSEPIDSVFVRSTGLLDPTGWAPDDHVYMQAETQAAMLAWLAALDCPVVNRPNAELWYRARLPLLHWLSPLRACGLPVPHIMISSDPAEIESFRSAIEAEGGDGAVFLSLAQRSGWLVGADDWDGVKALAEHGPVCLAEPHGPVSLLCIVGNQVVRNDEPATGDPVPRDRLLHFARLIGLEFVELGLAPVHGGVAVVHVEVLPRLEHFSPDAQSEILDGLVTVLLASAEHDRSRVFS